MRRRPTRRPLLALGLALLAWPHGSQAQDAALPSSAGAAAAPGGRIVYQVVPIVSGDRREVRTSLVAVPVLASTGQPLLAADLYLELGRPDLAAAYDARQARRVTLTVAGSVLALGGMIYAATRPGPDTGLPPEQFRQAMESQWQSQVHGMLAAIGGVAVLAVAAFTDPNPVDEAERRRLVEAHNSGLASGEGTAPPPAPGPRLSAGAALLPGGALAQVGVAF